MTRFIAIDGEGITTRTRHRYMHLRASTGESLTNLTGLSARRCLGFLVELAETYPGAVLVGFGLSYDLCMMLKREPKGQLRSLYDGAPVRLGETFEGQWTTRRSFQFSRWPIEWKRHGEQYRRLTPRYVLWDVFSFFQSSFVKALETYLPDQQEMIATIKAGKARRSRFRRSDLPMIRDYCALEVQALVLLMDRLSLDLTTAGLVLSRWDGAGACAAALLRREKVKNHLLECPEAVQLAAQHAYAGGRMELLQYGHHLGVVHHYDINSAYPAAIARLPSLSGVRWSYEDRRMATHWDRELHSHALDDGFQLYHLTWKGKVSNVWHPFFWRSSTGEIYFPPEGEGWYWAPEVHAAVRALRAGWWRGSLTILERLVPSWSEPPSAPFHFVPHLYEQRRQWKARGIGAEKVLKLAVNSLYGKMAQHVGGAGGKPRYHQLEWAGWVTSLTRAKLFTALGPHAKAGIMVATDGVYSLCPLPLPVSDQLGDWDYQRHTGLTVVQSGVYWTDDGSSESQFCRGFDPGSLKRNAILRAWRAGKRRWPATLTRFVGLGTALRSDKQWATFGEWRTQQRSLSLSMADTKRTDLHPRRDPSRGLVSTRATMSAEALFDPLSNPYPLPWRDDAAIPDRLILGLPESEVLAEMDDALL